MSVNSSSWVPSPVSSSSDAGRRSLAALLEQETEDCNARRAKKSTKWSAGQRAANARPFSSLFSRAASLSDGIGAQHSRLEEGDRSASISSSKIPHMTAQGISYRDSSSRALTPLRYDYKLPDSLNRKPWPSVPSLAVLAITIIVRNLDRIDVNPNAVPLNLAKKVVAVAAEQSNGWESIPVEIRWKFLRAYGPSIASHSTKMIKDAVVDLHIDIPVPVNQFLDLLISAHSSFPLLSHPPPLSSAVGIFITTLSLARTSITDTTVSPVARLTFLTALDLSFTLLTNYGVGQFRPRNACSAPEERRGLWMLRSLILKGCRGINERVGKDLKTFRGLNFIDVSMTPAGQQLSTLRHILNSASDRSNSSLRSPVRKWRTATSPLSGNTYEKQESTSLIVTSVKLSHASLSQPSKATPVKLAALNREAIDIEELLAPSSISASVESLEEMSTRKKMK